MLLYFDSYFETLEEDFAHGARRLGMGASLAHLNASGKSDYRAACTPDMRAAAGTAHGRDIALFGYGFDGFSRASCGSCDGWALNAPARE